MHCTIARVKNFERDRDDDDEYAYDENGNPRYNANDFTLAGVGEFDADSPRKVFAQLRELDLLSDYSKGKVSMVDYGDHIVIQDKDKFHPLYVLFHKYESPAEELPKHSMSLERIINQELLNIAKMADIDVEAIKREHNLGTYGEDFDNEGW